jgi:hypothetical protein
MSMHVNFKSSHLVDLRGVAVDSFYRSWFNVEALETASACEFLAD